MQRADAGVGDLQRAITVPGAGAVEGFPGPQRARPLRQLGDVGCLEALQPIHGHRGRESARPAHDGRAGLAGEPAIDSVALHVFDTIKGSDWLGDQDAIEIMCREAIDVLYEYERMGCIFSRTPDGRIAQRRFGGHSTPRANFAADWTGHVLLHTIDEQAQLHNVKFYSEWYCMDLIVEENVCRCVVAAVSAPGCPTVASASLQSIERVHPAGSRMDATLPVDR